LQVFIDIVRKSLRRQQPQILAQHVAIDQAFHYILINRVQ